MNIKSLIPKRGTLAARVAQHIAIVAVITLATFNPSGYSAFHLVEQSDDPLSAANVLMGIVLFIIHAVLIVVTWKSLGPLGITALVAILAALVYLVLDIGLISSSAIAEWLALIVYVLFVGCGSVSALVSRRLFGVFTTSEATPINQQPSGDEGTA